MATRRASIPEFLSVRSINSAYHFPALRDEAIGDVHDFPEIIYAHRGNTRILVDGKPIELCEGQILIYRPMSYHVATASGFVIDAFILSFDIASGALESFYNRPIALPPELCLRFMDLVRYAVFLLQSMQQNTAAGSMINRPSATDCELKRLGNTLESFLLDLISMEGAESNVTPRSPVPSYVEEARSYLRKNLHRSLTLSEIAKETHVSISTLTAQFRKHYGCSLITYVNTLRIERARQMLRTGSHSVTEAANTLGFSSIHYFSRLYRKHTGHSPSEDRPNRPKYKPSKQ